MICQLQGTLFFGTADKLYVELEGDLKRCRFIILDMRRVLSVDFTAAHMLELIEALLQEQGAFLLFSHMPAILPEGRDLQSYLDKVGVTGRQANVKVFAELDEAMAWAEDRLLEEHHLLLDENALTALELAEMELFRGIQPPENVAALRAGAIERPWRRAGRFSSAGIAATSCSWCAAARCASSCPSARGGIARWLILDAEIFLARWVSWINARVPPLPWPPPRRNCLCSGEAASTRFAGSARG